MDLAGRDCEDATGGRRRFAHLFGSRNQPREDLSLWRLCMVMAGFAPLFILLTVRGIDSVPDRWLWVACSVLVLGPMLLLAARLFCVFRGTEPSPLYVDDVEESRSHLVVYLFATLLPFYRQSLLDMRDLVAVLLALALIVFLFWRLNLHYVNILLVLQRRFKEGCSGVSRGRRGASRESGWPARCAAASPPANSATPRVRTALGAASHAPRGTPAAS